MTTVHTLTQEQILQLCQWHGASLSACTATSPAGYYEAIVRFSKWVEYNVNGLQAASDKFKMRMSGGRGYNLNTSGLSIMQGGEDWQKYSLTKGLWPDGTKIYRYSNGKLENNDIHVCYSYLGCSFKFADNFHSEDRNHFHHIDIKM